MEEINESKIYGAWSPILENKGIKDLRKKSWLSKYCHYRAQGSKMINENYSNLLNTPGVGNVNFPSNFGVSGGSFWGQNRGTVAGYKDIIALSLEIAQMCVGMDLVSTIPMKEPSGILPYLDVVYAGGKETYGTMGTSQNPNPGINSYKDKPLLIKMRLHSYSYFPQGGPSARKINDSDIGKTVYIVRNQVVTDTAVNSKFGITSAASGIDYVFAFQAKYVGRSFRTGEAIFRLLSEGYINIDISNANLYDTGDVYTKVNEINVNNKLTLEDVIPALSFTTSAPPNTYIFFENTASANTIFANTAINPTGPSSAANNVVLFVKESTTCQWVKSIEEHIWGFASAENDVWHGPFVDGTKTYNPMRRGVGEETYPNLLGLSVYTRAVECGTVQVGSSVTIEMMQDIQRVYNINAIPLLEQKMLEELSQTINKHILSKLFALGWTHHTILNEIEDVNLNLSINSAYTSGTETISYIDKEDVLKSMTIPAYKNYGAYENQDTAHSRVMANILTASNLIFQRNKRLGPATFIVTNAQIASALQKNSNYMLAKVENNLSQKSGMLYKMGEIAGMTLYVDPNMKWSDRRVLVGRLGDDNEPGLKFCPYILGESVQTIAEGTMSSKTIMKSRYALVEAKHFPECQYLTFYIREDLI